MSDVLDNPNVLNQRDPGGALGVAAQQYLQVAYDAKIAEDAHDGRTITSVVVTGMGGSALAALIAKVWLKNDLSIPFEVIRGYDLPAFVNEQTLVVASSYSGNTEETLSALKQAKEKGAQIGIIASGGKLIETANEHSIAHTHVGVLEVPSGLQPRMAMIYNLKALMLLFENFGVVTGKSAELATLEGWLQQESAQWGSEVPTSQNYAKQLAEEAVGKTPVFYGGALTAPLAYKWKISWNETSKNVAFWNEYPEFNHNEFMGWTSHPVEKPFAIFDLVSSFEHPQILKRFEISDRLLSGKRPKAMTIQLKGESVIAQLLWGAILADFASIYTAVLNGVDPTPVDLIEKLKSEL
jgi:glucose/mannose-6-phosphate isomerase